MNSNYNPFDPRSPYFPLTLTMMEESGNGPRRPRRNHGCGCGCLLVAAALLIALALLSMR